MGKFNLNEYDQVEDRIKKFYADHVDGRITTRVLFQDGERTMIKAYVYLNKEDQANKCPKATGTAEEVRIMTKSVSSSGSEYEEVNYSSWTENCETSAIGRALANMNLSGNKRPSRQEMEKVQRYSDSPSFASRGTTAPQGGIEMATPRQVETIKRLGGRADGLNKVQASELIGKLMETRNENY